MKPEKPLYRQVYEFIHDYAADRGYPPSVREIAVKMGKSRSYIQDVISRLVRDGYLERDPYKLRSLRIKDHLIQDPEERSKFVAEKINRILEMNGMLLVSESDIYLADVKKDGRFYVSSIFYPRIRH